MKKVSVFIKQILLVSILLVIAILLLNRQQSINKSSKPVVYGNPYAGGPGAGYASGEWKGRIDGSDARH